MTHPTSQAKPLPSRLLATFALASASVFAAPAFAQTPAVAAAPFFTTGNLVVLVEGCGVYNGTCLNVPNGTGTGLGNSSATGYGDNQAAPITLFQFTPIGTTSATYVNSLVLPQTASGTNLPVTGEYGSSSEGTLQLSGSGQYLSFAGYGIPIATFNANPAAYGAAPSLALAQSGSLTGQSYTPVARVIALVDKGGNVNSNTALYNIFNLNNPRSVYTFNGQNAYISGQGSGSDATGGVFLTRLGAPNSAPTAITGLDTTNNTIAQDTREVQFYNNTLYVSVDSKAGSNAARDFIGTLGTPGAAPTALTGPPLMLNGFGNSGGTGKVSITAGPLGTTNGNGMNAGQQINISPNNFFFANPATLYVADGGAPKNNSATSATGNGGLEKWINSQPDGTGTWSLAYTLAQGLSLVANTTGTGTSGLYGLAGSVSGNTVQLFATNYTLTDLDPTYLFGVTDNLTYTTPAQAVTETFTKLASAPADSNFKGVSFAPTISTPIITWNPPAAVTYGSALSDVQLNATTTVPGTFIYTPALGTVLPAGTQTLSVSFYPTDVINYAETTATTTITINPATPTTAANLVTTRVITRSGGNLLVQVTVANAGPTAVAPIITSVKIGSTSAIYLPLYFASIAPGTSSSVTATIPGSAGASGAPSSVTITGTITGGTFGSSARVTLPKPTFSRETRHLTTMKNILCTLVLATLTTAAAAAKADTNSITLDKPTQVATAGSTLAFYGTITNLSSATVFLNGDYFTILGAGALNDLNLNNVPFTLAAGANSGDIELFDVTVPATPVPATAESGSFGLTGGPDGNASNSLGSTSFNINTPVAAPEIDPSLASSGLVLVIGGIAVIRGRRLRHLA